METKLVLALGGGGVRGAAHLGVLHALGSAGIKVSGIAGTSSGAIAAMAYVAELAQARPAKENLRLIESVGREGFRELHHTFLGKPNHWRDRLRSLAGWEKVIVAGVRGPGIISLEPLRKALLAVGGGLSFEDIDLPLAFIATDVMSGEKVVLRVGDLAAAALASSAIPGVFPPVEHLGRLLADGHIVDNVPVTTARELVDGPCVVLAVDVGFDAPVQAPKTALESIMRAATISREHLRRQSLAQADVVLRISSEVEASVFETDRAHELFDVGLVRGAQILPAVKAALQEKNKANRARENGVRSIFAALPKITGSKITESNFAPKLTKSKGPSNGFDA